MPNQNPNLDDMLINDPTDTAERDAGTLERVVNWGPGQEWVTIGPDMDTDSNSSVAQGSTTQVPARRSPSERLDARLAAARRRAETYRSRHGDPFEGLARIINYDALDEETLEAILSSPY